MTNRQKEILIEAGFEDIVTNQVIQVLNKKSTKAAKNAIKRINELEEIGPFEIYKSKENFTILSPIIVTKEEINQIRQILQLDYIRLGNALYNKDLWIEWVTEEQK